MREAENETEDAGGAAGAAINEALRRMEDDRRLKRSVKNLAKLSGCSRGTLYNYGWPVIRLQKLKLTRPEPKPPLKPAKSAEWDREKSDRELVRWKHLHRELQEENSALRERCAALERDAQHRSTGGPDRSGPSKIVPWPRMQGDSD